ncbi:MAG: YkgJ family cysteine cluster protein [Desulfarculaceae bacterium]|nr:YkgJ family cysteine cluster protein [Desulfarculaceae bacterium]MCF8070931.1 YkgJ family cysteine cluster protein [Desulfarculaceae bacterium]MCF8100519.1 YkgJ family cysteine cluster protein [Desulfarculaceae bacterium]MCF8116545.1 YkgJ family cysteine cluster protein [Desulfarculaceae bacterium]
MSERLSAAAAQGTASLLEACALELSARRGLDHQGAAKAVAGDAELARLIAADAPPGELAARLSALAGAGRCLGCGSCCRVSSPTLYAEDLPRLRRAGLGWEELYTLRAGEKVFSARLGRFQVLDDELIKLRERGGACVRLTPRGCGMYEQRPLQCRWLECWSGRHAGQLTDRPRLGRPDLLASDETALALAGEYEAKVPAEELHAALAGAAAGDAQATDKALALLELDHRLRAGISAKYGHAPESLPLILGRPAVEIAANYGLELTLQDGRPALRKKH